jgi:hypothetical protein
MGIDVHREREHWRKETRRYEWIEIKAKKVKIKRNQKGKSGKKVKVRKNIRTRHIVMIQDMKSKYVDVSAYIQHKRNTC